MLAALDPSAAATAPHCSPEARAARAAFVDARTDLREALAGCASGLELVALGWNDDVETASALDATALAAELTGGAFVAG